MSHEGALQKALLVHLREDTAVSALLGTRVWNAPPNQPEFPHLTIGRTESRPIGADGGGIEHRVTLTVRSRFRGTEEVKAILAAVRLALEEARLEADGVRTVGLGVRHAEVWPSADGQRTFAVLLVRAVTEDV